MNHLLRSIAPVTESGWELLDDEAQQRLTPALAARKLVDFAGPRGWGHSATNLGRSTVIEKAPAEGITARVISMPCVEWFNKQDAAYREAVLPAAVKARVSVEAGLALGWKEFVGDAGRSISLEHYGASADYKRLFQEFGITAEAVAAAARDSLAAARN